MYQAAQLIVSSENSPKIVLDLSEDIKMSLETTSAMLSALAWILKGWICMIFQNFTKYFA